MAREKFFPEPWSILSGTEATTRVSLAGNSVAIIPGVGLRKLLPTVAPTTGWRDHDPGEPSPADRSLWV